MQNSKANEENVKGSYVTLLLDDFFNKTPKGTHYKTKKEMMYLTRINPKLFCSRKGTAESIGSEVTLNPTTKAVMCGDIHFKEPLKSARKTQPREGKSDDQQLMLGEIHSRSMRRTFVQSHSNQSCAREWRTA